MIKSNQIARGVRIRLNSKFTIKSLSDQYLACEPIIFISDEHVYNDERGHYVYIKGGSLTNGGIAYLSELDLEYNVPEFPIYPHTEIDYSQDLSRFNSEL